MFFVLIRDASVIPGFVDEVAFKMGLEGWVWNAELMESSLYYFLKSLLEIVPSAQEVYYLTCIPKP